MENEVIFKGRRSHDHTIEIIEIKMPKMWRILVETRITFLYKYFLTRQKLKYIYKLLPCMD